MKYSVIIPVYKAEKTIGRCLDSLLNQPHDDVELLIINDGSPDDCGKVCREYASNYSCIRYFEKENGGVSSARNLGLEEAVGDYILFVDSDDYVDSKYFATISAALDESHPDMLLFSVQNVGGGNQVWDTGNYVVDKELEVARKTNEAVQAYLFSNLLSKTFSRKIIQKYNLEFDEELSIGEDQAFVFKYAMHIRKMASISNILYYFVIGNSNSLSRKRRTYLSEQLLKINLDMLSSLNEAAFSERTKDVYLESIVWTHYRSAYSACKELLKFDIPSAERKKRIKQICEMYTIGEMKPIHFRSKVIAFPIVHKLSFVIDALAIHNYRRRQVVPDTLLKQ